MGDLLLEFTYSFRLWKSFPFSAWIASATFCIEPRSTNAKLQRKGTAALSPAQTEPQEGPKPGNGLLSPLRGQERGWVTPNTQGGHKLTPSFGLGSGGAGPGDWEMCADPFTICHRAWLWVSFILLPTEVQSPFTALNIRKEKYPDFRGNQG